MISVEKLEEKVRSAPLQSVGIGLVGAWILSRLPVFGIVSLVVRIALVLVKPALFVLGGMKAWEYYQSRRGETSQSLPESHF